MARRGGREGNRARHRREPALGHVGGALAAGRCKGPGPNGSEADGQGSHTQYQTGDGVGRVVVPPVDAGQGDTGDQDNREDPGQDARRRLPGHHGHYQGDAAVEDQRGRHVAGRPAEGRRGRADVGDVRAGSGHDHVGHQEGSQLHAEGDHQGDRQSEVVTHRGDEGHDGGHGDNAHGVGQQSEVGGHSVVRRGAMPSEPAVDVVVPAADVVDKEMGGQQSGGDQDTDHGGCAPDDEGDGLGNRATPPHRWPLTVGAFDC